MYNADLALQIMNKMNFTSGFFELWFDRVLQAKYDIEVKRMIIGISHIVSLPSDVMPSFCKEGLPDITEQLVILCKKSFELRDSKDGAIHRPGRVGNDETLKEYDLEADWSDYSSEGDGYDPETDEEVVTSRDLY